MLRNYLLDDDLLINFFITLFCESPSTEVLIESYVCLGTYVDNVRK